MSLHHNGATYITEPGPPHRWITVTLPIEWVQWQAGVLPDNVSMSAFPARHVTEACQRALGLPDDAAPAEPA